MAQDNPLRGRLIIVGANHRSSSLGLRDRLFVEDSDMPGFLAELRRSGFRQAMVLATCDRIEIHAIDPGLGHARDVIGRVLADRAGLTADEVTAQLYVLAEVEAVRHLFAVCASLDSQIIGEPQVLGQVKASHRMARDAAMTGGELEAILQAAYVAAKRVRSETAIGQRPVSISASAVQVAREVHGDLGTCSGLMVGGGDMGALIAEELRTAGLGRLTVAHPSEARAEALARTLEAHVTPFETLAAGLADADIILSAVGTRRHVITADMVRAALRRRRRRPVFLIDAAVPGDIEPAVNRIDEAYLYDLADLERVALDGRADREAEARAAWAIIDDEVARFLRDRAERGAVPAVVELRARFEEVRRSVLTVAGDDAERATRLLVNRLLHDPSEALREAAAGGAGNDAVPWPMVERVVRRLFGLDLSADRDRAQDGAEGEETKR